MAPLLWVLLITLPVACGDVTEPESVQTDSWSVGAPDIVVGSRVSGPITFSRIESVVPDPEGGLVVMEPTVPRVVVFDSTGALSDSIGRRGEGPGEFLRPTRIGFVGDTLWVLDGAVGRVSYFVGSDFVRSEPLPEVPELHSERGARVAGVLAGHRLLVATDRWNFRFPLVTSTPGGLFSYREGSFEPIAKVNVNHGGGAVQRREGGQLAGIMLFSQPFSESSKWAIQPGGSSLIVADRRSPDDSAYSVVRLRPDGDTVEHIVQDVDPVPLPPAVGDSVVGTLLQDPFTEAEVRSALHLPGIYPPVSDVIAAPDGTVWVGREKLPGPARSWDVQADGGRVATVSTPDGFEPYVPLGAHVWGVETDELDIPYLVRRPILTGSEAGGTGGSGRPRNP